MHETVNMHDARSGKDSGDPLTGVSWAAGRSRALAGFLSDTRPCSGCGWLPSIATEGSSMEVMYKAS